MPPSNFLQKEETQLWKKAVAQIPDTLLHQIPETQDSKILWPKVQSTKPVSPKEPAAPNPYTPET